LKACEEISAVRAPQQHLKTLDENSDQQSPFTFLSAGFYIVRYKKLFLYKQIPHSDGAVRHPDSNPAFAEYGKISPAAVPRRLAHANQRGKQHPARGQPCVSLRGKNHSRAQQRSRLLHVHKNSSDTIFVQTITGFSDL
jgi:hypothetical protein